MLFRHFKFTILTIHDLTLVINPYNGLNLALVYSAMATGSGTAINHIR